jgi:MFS family permease
VTALRHLVHLLHGRWFRRLFAVRVLSQLVDGVFQVALASYVIFSPEHAASPGAIAAALASVLLPFSVLGPFVGVFLDRWSRRQVLAWSNFVRVGMVAVLAVVVRAGTRGLLLFGLILLTLSVNRFLLAGLSASLPHVVTYEDLITANALTPTAGTLAVLVGLGVGTVLRSPLHGDVGVLFVAAFGYLLAGCTALLIPRRMLGPDIAVHRPGLGAAFAAVVTGLVAGLRHLRRRRSAAYGLGAIAVHRFCYGISTVALILLYRNYFYPGQSDAAFDGLARAVLASGVGFVGAAALTPVVTERIGPRAWIVVLLAFASVTQVLPGAFYTQPALLVSAFALGLASQGIKICVDTLVQTHIDDEFRGRVFSLYDVVFNVAFVAAAAAGALVLPQDGKSYAVLGASALGYALTAAWYWTVTTQQPWATPAKLFR